MELTQGFTDLTWYVSMDGYRDATSLVSLVSRWDYCWIPPLESWAALGNWDSAEGGSRCDPGSYRNPRAWEAAII